jgi:hypothetical protein
VLAGTPSRPGRSASSPTTTSTTPGWSGPSARWRTRPTEEDPHRHQRRAGRASAPRPWSRWGRGSPGRLRLALAARGADAAGPDPLVGLAWVVGRLPGPEDRHHHAAAGPQPGVAGQGGGHARPALGWRFLLTFVPGLAIGGERSAIGIPSGRAGRPDGRGAPGLRQLWAGEVGQPRRTRRARSPTSRSRPDRFRIPSTCGSAATRRRRSNGAGGSATDGSRPCARRGCRGGEGRDRRGGGRARARHQPRALRGQPRLCAAPGPTWVR